jgi:serine/threonine-protein kinase
MREGPKVAPMVRSASELLAAIERSHILPDAKWQEVNERFGHRLARDGSLKLAQQLVDEGTLTSFQAAWLLKGKSPVFGRYDLLERIGRGARGNVYKARHRLMDRIVALKVLSIDSATDGNAVPRFFREMKIVGRLEHPNVVRAIDADIHDGFPYIVMEYLEGDDLERVFVRRGPLPPEEVIEHMAQAARGLAHAHEKGVIHRDVKPTNVFLVSTGVVKLLDLGFGELVGPSGQTGNVFDTDEGVVVGTRDFISPEQITDKPIDARTDLFSLGCTMYHLLTGAFAFPGLTKEHRLVKRIREPHVPITEVRQGLSDGLVAIVDRLLATRPDDRFASAALVAEALEALVRPAGRPEGVTSAKPETNAAGAGATALGAEPEAPLDWSRIESALRPKSHHARESRRRAAATQPEPRSTQGLTSHRKRIEEEGAESGREVHEKYRQELIQMKREMAELRATEARDGARADGDTWFERIGEKIGDFLAEPSAGQIVIGILLVLLVLTLVFVYVVG